MSSINTNYWPTICKFDNGRSKILEYILEYNSTWCVLVDQPVRHLCTWIAILICQQQLLQLLVWLFPIPMYVCNGLLFRTPYLVVWYFVLNPFLHQVLEILYFVSVIFKYIFMKFFGKKIRIHHSIIFVHPNWWISVRTVVYCDDS